MMPYKNAFNKIYPPLNRAGRALWRVLSFSLADPAFSFAKIVCVSFEADGVCLAYVEKMLWRVNIRRVRRCPLPQGQAVSPEFAAQAAAAFVRDFQITDARFVLGWPRSWVIVREAEFPLAAKEDLPRVIEFELDRLTPLSRDNACYDYTAVGEDDRNIRILLTVARADQINACLETFKGKGISVDKISLNVFLIRFIIGQTYPHTNAVFLSLRGDAYEGGSLVQGLIAQPFTGGAMPGDPDGADAAIRQTGDAMNELMKSGSPPRIVVDADEKDYGRIREAFRTVTVSHLNKDLKTTLPKPAAELSAVAVSGALDAARSRPDAVNLLAKNNHGAPRTPWLLSAVLLVMIAASAVYYFIAPVYLQRQTLDALDQQIQALRPQVRKAEALHSEAAALENDIQAINAFRTHSDLAMNIIKDMTAALPPKTWLTRLHITDKIAEIEGYSTSATEIILKLENSRYFQKAEFSSPTFRDPRQNTERFVIKMELKNAGEKKEPERKEAGKKEPKKEMSYEKKK
ncbi:MAG: hypothetical protein EG826_11405 [Deltaproteobacteria bacterium]|nr:hypothetical protein [Deltaproteobacteria bacterium]